MIWCLPRLPQWAATLPPSRGELSKLCLFVVRSSNSYKQTHRDTARSPSMSMSSKAVEASCAKSVPFHSHRGVSSRDVPLCPSSFQRRKTRRAVTKLGRRRKLRSCIQVGVVEGEFFLYSLSAVCLGMSNEKDATWATYLLLPPVGGIPDDVVASLMLGAENLRVHRLVFREPDLRPLVPAPVALVPMVC